MLSGRPHDKSCDLWSMGVVTYTLLSGKLPFGDDIELIKAGNVDFSGEEWKIISDNAKDFITFLL